jgi:hypothetical protein
MDRPEDEQKQSAEDRLFDSLFKKDGEKKLDSHDKTKEQVERPRRDPETQSITQKVLQEAKAEITRSIRKALYERGGFLGRVIAASTGEGYFSKETKRTGKTVSERIDEHNKSVLDSVDKINRAVTKGTDTLSRHLKTIGTKVDTSIKKTLDTIQRTEAPVDRLRPKSGVSAGGTQGGSGINPILAALGAAAGLTFAGIGTAAAGVRPQRSLQEEREEDKNEPVIEAPKENRDPSLEDKKVPVLEKAEHKSRDFVFRAKEIVFEATEFKFETRNGNPFQQQQAPTSGAPGGSSPKSAEPPLTKGPDKPGEQPAGGGGSSAPQQPSVSAPPTPGGVQLPDMDVPAAPSSAGGSPGRSSPVASAPPMRPVTAQARETGASSSLNRAAVTAGLERAGVTPEMQNFRGISPNVKPSGEASEWAIANRRTQEALGISPQEWDAHRRAVGNIESKNNPNMGAGGARGHYWGMYQFGSGATADTNRFLGENVSRQQFQGNQQLAERHFDAYSRINHDRLMKFPEYRALSPQQKLATLGYAHNQGSGDSQVGNVVGAARWLKQGGPNNPAAGGRDAFGTGGTKYYHASMAALRNIPTGPQWKAPTREAATWAFPGQNPVVGASQNTWEGQAPTPVTAGRSLNTMSTELESKKMTPPQSPVQQREAARGLSDGAPVETEQKDEEPPATNHSSDRFGGRDFPGLGTNVIAEANPGRGS